MPTNVTDRLGRSIKRVLLIANNSDYSPTDTLIASIDPSDLIVQYNDCRYYHSFKRSKCSKLFVFRSDGRKGVNFGFSRWTRKFAHLRNKTGNDGLSILFVDTIPDVSQPPAGLDKILKSSGACSFIDTSETIFNAYPTPPGFECAGPSTGFATLMLLLHARDDLRRTGAGDFEIVVHGFSDASDGRFWGGHNWAYERKFIAGLGDQVSLARGRSNA